MKNGLLLLLVLMLLAGQAYSSLFVTAAGEEASLVQLEQAFEERCQLWNELLEGRLTDKQDILPRLAGFVAEPLLSADEAVFTELMENPTSYEGITGMEILEAQRLRATYREQTWQVTMGWQLAGYEGPYEQTVSYRVQLVRQGETWLLSDYTSQ